MSTFPDQAALSSAKELQVFDAQGQLVSSLSSVRLGEDSCRHFFCGSCKAYVENPARVPSAALTKSGVDIIVVRCGEWQPIASYAQETGFTGKIYADPTRKLYRALRMTTEKLSGTPSGQTKRSYIKSSMLTNALQSIYKGPLSHPTLVGKQGNVSQLGGDFVFGPDKEVIFCSRMKHTEDHIEISELVKEAGVTL